MNITQKNQIAIELLKSYYNADIDNYYLDDRLSALGTSPLLNLFKNYMFCLYDDTKRHMWIDFYTAEVQFFLSSWLYFLYNDIDACDLKAKYGILWGKKISWGEVFQQIVTGNQLDENVLFIPPITYKLINNMTSKLTTTTAKRLLDTVFTRPLEICCKQRSFCNQRNNISEIINKLPASLVNDRIIDYIIPHDCLAVILLDSFIPIAIDIPMFQMSMMDISR